MSTRALIATALLALAGVTAVLAQDRIKEMPGYDQFTRMQPQINGSVTPGSLGVTWAADGKSFTYNFAGKSYKYDTDTRQVAVTGDAPEPAAGGRGARGGRGGQPPAAGRGGMEQEQSEMPATPVEGCPTGGTARGRQAFCVESPDHKLKAFYRNRNLWIANLDGSNEKAISTDGSEKGRIKYGTGSWVYGEELAQTTAIWWSPDSSKVGYYRFDESQVKDFYLQMNQTAVQDTMDIEAYPKPGAPNPIADIFIYDVAAGKPVKMDIRDGKPFSDTVVGHYAYDVRWSPDGAELFLNRTNRRQQIMEFVACSPASGACRVVVREEWPTGWTNNRPAMQYLKDNRRFIWESERNGWRNFYLYDLSGKQLATLTNNTTFEAGNSMRQPASCSTRRATATTS
jgi:dipeptidyl-peptidase 4